MLQMLLSKRKGLLKNITPNGVLLKDKIHIRLLSFESNTLVILDYFRECDARKAIDASNRYFKINDTFKIPIIVSYDLAYSPLSLNDNRERFDK